MPSSSAASDDVFSGYSPDRPAPARMYDYMLGGKDNYEADRDAADRATALFPELPAVAKANRRFLEEAVTRAARAGITQYLDLGAGLPTSPNTHEVASRHIDAPHVVYADRDPVVVSHSAALRHVPGTGTVRADITDTAAVLESGAVRDLIDFSRPVAIMLIAVLHFVSGDVDPVVRAYRDAAAPGSWLIVSHIAESDDVDRQAGDEATDIYREGGNASPQSRTPAEIRALFGDWVLIDPPGLADVRTWAGAAAPGQGDLLMSAGIAVKP